MSLRGMVAGVVADFRQELEELVSGLEGEGLTPVSFQAFVGGLKTAINEAGLKTLIEAIVEFDERADVVERDGRDHRFKHFSEKEWLTPFGLAVISRGYYQPDVGGEGFIPLDHRCGMVDRYMTADVEEMTSFASAMLVPREVETLLGKFLPRGPSTTAVQRVIHDVGAFAEHGWDEVEEVVRKEAPFSSEGEVLVISFDGVTVPLREAGVKRGRPAERPGVRENNETSTSWKEAGVGTISIYAFAKEGEDESKRLDTRYLARMPEVRMKRLLEQQESVAAGLLENHDFQEVVVLCDGKPSIWNAVDGIETYKDATRILDFFHVSEQLSRAAEAIFGKKEAQASRWHQKYRARLLEDPDGRTAAIRSLRYYLGKLRKGTDRYKAVRGVSKYLARNLDKIAYAEFRVRGLPIGSGPVEAACKTVVGARLKRSGMRWSRGGAQEVLNLRTRVLSGEWNAFWNAYQASRPAA